MDWMQYMLAGATSVLAAFLSYIASRQRGKFDLKKLSEENKADIEKLSYHENPVIRLNPVEHSDIFLYLFAKEIRH